jgi:uncharacterized protein YacL
MHNQKSTKKRSYLIFMHLVGGLFFAIILCNIFGLFVWLLWNYLMPDLLGLKSITFLQSVALVILIRLLVGSFSGRNFLSKHHEKSSHERSNES